MPPASRRFASTSAILFSATALVACGGGDPLDGPTTSRNLLAQLPWERHEQSGSVAPDEVDGPGDAFARGWRQAVLVMRNGHPFLVSDDQDATVTLYAAQPRSRTLELEVWGPEEETGGAVLEVELNGEPVGVVDLPNRRKTLRFATPLEHWVAGQNRLLLRRRGGSVAEEKRRLAVSRVGFDAPALLLADPIAGELTLAPGLGAAWWATYASPAVLDLSGAAVAEGTVGVTLTIVDPVTGTADGAPTVLRIDAGAGPLSERLPLPPAVDRVVRIELNWTTSGGEGVLALTAATLTEPGERARPPVVFVTLDTLAARHTSLLGYPRQTTPNLSALADEGVTFERCSSNAPWTGQSYFSQLTGQPARVFAPEAYEDAEDVPPSAWVLPRRAWTLAEILRAAGYRTAGFVDSPWLLEGSRIDQGFELFDSSAYRIPINVAEGGLRHEVPLALEWLDALGDGAPPFLFLHGKDVHGPYLPAAPHDGAFGEDTHVDRDRVEPLGPLNNMFAHVPPYVGRPAYPDAVEGTLLRTAALVDAYDEEILAADAVLGELFDALRARGILDEALVIVSSDHGESMLSHGLFFGHGLPYEDVLHVPLVLRLPGGRYAGLRLNEPVQLLDLLPTLVELLDLDVPVDSLSGRSLAPLLEGGQVTAAPLISTGKIFGARSVTWEGWKLVELDLIRGLPSLVLTHPASQEWLREHRPELAARVAAGMTKTGLPDPGELALIAGQLRAALDRTQVQLFRLDEDPDEERDVSAAHPDVVEKLRGFLVADDAHSLRMRAMLTIDAEPGAALSAEDRAQMAALGYADFEDE